MTFVEELREAWRLHQDEAREAYALVEGWHDRPVERIPGCDTALRLAHRIYHGRTVEEAAAREYVYRWSLALRSARVFPVPHTLGL